MTPVIHFGVITFYKRKTLPFLKWLTDIHTIEYILITNLMH